MKSIVRRRLISLSVGGGHFLREPASDRVPQFLWLHHAFCVVVWRHAGVAAANLLDLVLHVQQLYFCFVSARQSSGGWTSSWKCFSLPFFCDWIALLIRCLVLRDNVRSVQPKKGKKSLISRWAASRVRLLIARQLCWSFFFFVSLFTCIQAKIFYLILLLFSPEKELSASLIDTTSWLKEEK